MVKKEKKDDKFYVREISLIIDNPLLPADRNIEEVERLMSSRRGLKGGGQVFKLYGRQHYVEMGKKGRGKHKAK